MRRCPKCGFLLNENDRYCENCGEDCSAVEDYETTETVSLNEPKDEQKEKLKKQWKIAGIVFGAFVLVFAGILALVLFPLNNSSHSDTKTKSESSLTEPTTVEEGIVPLNESVVEESSNDTGARVKYDFYGFWKSIKVFVYHGCHHQKATAINMIMSNRRSIYYPMYQITILITVIRNEPIQLRNFILRKIYQG